MVSPHSVNPGGAHGIVVETRSLIAGDTDDDQPVGGPCSRLVLTHPLHHLSTTEFAFATKVFRPVRDVRVLRALRVLRKTSFV